MSECGYPRSYSSGCRAPSRAGSGSGSPFARALAAEPHILICDEVTSALDVSVEASILDLIDSLRADSGMAVLLIAHDLRVVRRIADRAVVLHDGRVREHGPVEDVLGAPRHELTRALVAADRPSRQSSAIESNASGLRGACRKPRRNDHRPGVPSAHTPLDLLFMLRRHAGRSRQLSTANATRHEGK